MILVFDSTPLIYLSKVKILEKLKKIHSRNIIPSLVYQEVVEKGLALGKEDALYLHNLIEQKLFEILKFDEPLELLPNLSSADIEVLALAKKLKGIAVLDEEMARGIAGLKGIETIGSLGILFSLLNQNITTKKELRDVFDQMISEGWFCSTDLYSFVLRELER